MADWHDTQAFFKEHWRPIVIVSVIVVAMVVAISLTLVFTLRRIVQPSASVTPFNGPLDINGDPPQSSNVFQYPQIISNPLPGSTLFGRNMYVHEAGYVATTLNRTPSGPPSVLFYYTNLNGELQGPQEILLDLLPAGYTVCNGAFAPIFNTSGEVYYLFLSVGPMDAFGDLCPVNVLLFSLDTTTTSNVWTLSSINSTYTTNFPGSTIQVMKLPSSTFVWNPSSGPNLGQIWYGTFGNKIQVVMDDNEAVVKQSLYISGSEFDPNLPGGNLYWFVLLDNTVSPNITLLYTIQDAKLLMMKQQGGCPNSQCSPCTGDCAGIDNTSREICMNGFGSDFYVTSGNKSKNILVVANSTPQDNCQLDQSSDQPCFPKGYVQGYTLNAQGGTQSWVQPQDSGSQSFYYRYGGTMMDPNILGGVTTYGGFANSVSVANGKIFIGQGEPDDTTGNAGNGVFLVFDWVLYPVQQGILMPISTFKPAPFPLTNMYPKKSDNGLRYNQGVQTIGDGSNQLLATSWYYPGPGDVISIQTASGPSDNPYANFELVQSLGAGYSSQTPSSPEQALLGFAQNTATWISRTGVTVRLAFNDPCRQNNAGRIVILTRRRQG